MSVSTTVFFKRLNSRTATVINTGEKISGFDKDSNGWASGLKAGKMRIASWRCMKWTGLHPSYMPDAVSFRHCDVWVFAQLNSLKRAGLSAPGFLTHVKRIRRFFLSFFKRLKPQINKQSGLFYDVNYFFGLQYTYPNRFLIIELKTDLKTTTAKSSFKSIYLHLK